MPSLDARIAALFASAPIRRSRDFEAAGIPRITISRAQASGYIRRLARGVYSLPDFQPNESGDLALVARRVPEAVVCLLSALSFHGITTQTPAEVWIAIPHKAWAPRLEYPALRIVRYSGDGFGHGVVDTTIEGTPVKMTTIEKTIADCFKFRNRIGLDVALEALREATRMRKLDRAELWACAKVDRVTNIILPYLEATA
jgi:Predicted transcriptional regulator